LSREERAEVPTVEGLRRKVGELEREVNDLKTALAIQAGASETSPIDLEGDVPMLRELRRLREKLDRVEKENHEFAKMYVEIQEQNEALANLYVASQRLHATFDLEGVKRIITEILVEMVGAEEFGLLVLDREKKELHLLTGEGMEHRLPRETLPAGEGIIGDVAATGESFFFVPKTEAEKQASLPIATLPLKLNEQTVGVMVIYKLLGHKPSFSPIDHQVLELVAAHAASALVSARLHGTMDRKLKTIEGFMQLMKHR
jgi:nitrate/nitrite-specific signal transduction histidine kinase